MRPSFASLLVFLVGVGACGGQVSPGDGGTGSPGPGTSIPPGSTTSSGSGGGAGSDPGFVPGVCPVDPPAYGVPCASPNHGCAYDGFHGVTCQAVVCDATGHWGPTDGGC